MDPFKLVFKCVEVVVSPSKCFANFDAEEPDRTTVGGAGQGNQECKENGKGVGEPGGVTRTEH